MTHEMSGQSTNPRGIRLRGLSRCHPGPPATWALRDVDLDIAPGGGVAVVGPSGSGKTSLAHLICGIDAPSSGTVQVDGVALGTLAPSALARWRGLNIGVVFQAHHLLPTLTALENVVLPMELCQRWPVAERADRAQALLLRLGVGDQAHKLPSDMSGGQQQRVAIARALANDPPWIVADEPTGQLDSANSALVWDTLADLADAGRTVIAVTHEARPRFARRIHLLDGRVCAP